MIDAGTPYTDRTFRGIDQSGGNISESEFYDCVFEACSFLEVRFEKCRFVQCSFQNCDLSVIHVPGSSFTAVRFVGSKLIGVDWTQAHWPAERLDGALGFERCALSHSTFIGLSMPRLQVRDCEAVDVDFREARLTGADFRGTNLTESLFLGTDLTGADFSQARDYRIDVRQNVVKGAKFALPEAVSLLYSLDIVLVGGS